MIWVPIEDGEEPQAHFGRLIAFSSKQGQPVRPKLFKIMDKEELKMRRRQQMMFKINEKYIKDLKLRNLHEFYLENEKILNDYEKTRTNWICTKTHSRT